MGSQRVVGLLLVAIGLALLLALTTDVGGQVVVAALGVGFLAAYAATRSYGYLVPGAILTGLGTGIVVADLGGPEGAIQLGLGLGFLAIAVLDRLTGGTGSGWWWPFIPGGILTVAGGSDISGVRNVGVYVVPAVLIVVGIWLVFRRPRATPD